MRWRDGVELVVLAALWGASFLFMRAGVGEFGPIALIEVRLAVAALFLLPILVWQHGLHEFGRHLPALAVVGTTNSLLPFVLFAFALQSITAGLGAILNATAPLFGALIAWAWLGDRLVWPRWVGLAVGFAGVAILIWDRASFRDGGSGWALAASLAASVLYGLSASITKRHLGGVSPLTTATGSQVTAALLLAPAAIVSWPSTAPSAAAWAGVVTLGIASTGMAYVLYFRLIAHVGPAKAIAVTFVVPAFGMVWGSLFLGEPVTTRMLAGCAVIVAGTALATGFIGARGVSAAAVRASR